MHACQIEKFTFTCSPHLLFLSPVSLLAPKQNPRWLEQMGRRELELAFWCENAATIKSSSNVTFVHPTVFLLGETFFAFLLMLMNLIQFTRARIGRSSNWNCWIICYKRYRVFQMKTPNMKRKSRILCIIKAFMKISGNANPQFWFLKYQLSL